jgi:hypothetical protein
MKIAWHNPNPIDVKSFSIMKTLTVEQPDELRAFYRSSRGRWTLGTIFELLVNRDAVSPVRHNPSVNHLGSFECQPAAPRDSKIGETLYSTAHRILNAFASQCGQIFHGPLRAGKGSRKESQLSFWTLVQVRLYGKSRQSHGKPGLFDKTTARPWPRESPRYSARSGAE